MVVFFASLGVFPATAIATTGGDLWIDGPTGTLDAGAQMMAATSPSITALSAGGYEIACEGTNGDLWTYGTGESGDTGDAMLAGTSPSIVAVSSTQYEVAYQASNGDLSESASGNCDSHRQRDDGRDEPERHRALERWLRDRLPRAPEPTGGHDARLGLGSHPAVVGER